MRQKAGRDAERLTCLADQGVPSIDRRGKFDHLGHDSPHQAKARESIADLRKRQ